LDTLFAELDGSDGAAMYEGLSQSASFFACVEDHGVRRAMSPSPLLPLQLYVPDGSVTEPEQLPAKMTSGHDAKPSPYGVNVPFVFAMHHRGKGEH
jgi:hypothetical protein